MLHDEHSSSSSAGAELDLEQLLLNPQPEHGGAAGQSDSGDEVLSASGLVERVRSLFVLESLLPDQLLGVSCSAELECLERDLLGEARRQCGSSTGTQQQSFKRIQLLEIERISYLKNCYYHFRLKKISKYPHYYLKLDSETVDSGFNLLSNQEYRFAKKLAELDEKYLNDTFMMRLPKQITSQNISNLAPCQDEFVFFKVLEDQPGFSYKDKDEIFEFPLSAGDQYLMKCKFVTELIWTGKVMLM